MKTEILELINNNRKAYAKLIKNNRELFEWIEANTLIKEDNWPKKIYSALYNESFVCKYGNQLNLNSVHEGTKFCGKAKNCRCAKEQISQKISVNKKSYSEETKKKIAEKRAKTNLEKYGVENIGQTEKAKNNHKKYYDNKPKIHKELKNLKKIGFEQLSNYVQTKLNFTLLTPFEKYYGIRQKDAHEYEFQCKKCLTKIKKKFYHGKGIRCDICNPLIPSFKSGEENEVFNFIKNLGIDGNQRDRQLINPFELDMVFPDHKIAIEYCGLYWHSELSADKDRNYHANKMNLVQAKGWKLITIFSDEWKQQRSKVENRLKNIFNKTEIKIPARKCVVETISTFESKNFMNTYHLQGSAVAKVHLGLKFNNELVAVMTFSNGRKSLNSINKDTNIYELVRFSTNGYNVQGGASKLLKHFIKKYNPSKVFSYSDCRWSQGQLYQSLGFVKENNPSIGYWYVEKYETRKHRYNFTKQSLIKKGYDKNLTEWQIMQALKYDRIWDCGQQKWSIEF